MTAVVIEYFKDFSSSVKNNVSILFFETGSALSAES
jgi:hypothetical protein